MYDVIIVGAGAVGCAIARELSFYHLSVLVLEKECDVAAETSGRNSAVVHAGFNNKPGSLMARFCVEGNQHFEALCKDLDVPYKKTGKVLVAFDEDDLETLEHLVGQANANGCKGIHMIDADELRRRVPGVGGIGGMLSPNTALISPFKYTIALAENAAANGVSFHFEEPVIDIVKMTYAPDNACGNQADHITPRNNQTAYSTTGGYHIDHNSFCDNQTGCGTAGDNPTNRGTSCDSQAMHSSHSGHGGEGFTVRTPKSSYDCRFLINSAGLFSDRISAMAGVDDYQIHPCRGEYYILDSIADRYLDVPVYPAPKKGIGGLGVHLTPTVSGNIIIGPSAEYIDECDDYSSTSPIMQKLWREAQQLMPALQRKDIIGTYTGIRPKLAPKNEGGYHDFIIKSEPACPHLINLIGIESPGLTASVPIAHYVRDILGEMMTLSLAEGRSHEHRFPVTFRDLSLDEQKALITDDPDYGDIVCRCRKITRREIRDAIENPLGVRSISAIKYRAWATTGRCNGGYCLSRIVDMLVHDYGMKPEEITYRGSGSEMFTGEVK